MIFKACLFATHLTGREPKTGPIFSRAANATGYCSLLGFLLSFRDGLWITRLLSRWGIKVNISVFPPCQLWQKSILVHPSFVLCWDRFSIFPAIQRRFLWLTELGAREFSKDRKVTIFRDKNSTELFGGKRTPQFVLDYKAKQRINSTKVASTENNKCFTISYFLVSRTLISLTVFHLYFSGREI